ncbi:MAG: Ig-like domain-containing protein [Candidatus Sulfotelmatobacter sp.]
MKKFQTLMALLCLGLLPACSSNNSTATSAPTLTSIQITLTNPSVAAGLTDQLTATGKYSDGTSKDLTASVTWTSSNTNVATVAAGVVTTLAQGTAKITGTLSGVSGSVTLTVGAPAITKLVVSSTSASIARGTTVQFTATGTLTDGTTENATGLVTWSSSNSLVVSINVNGAQGLAMGVTAGMATITATANGVSASATLTVTSATLTSINVTPVNAQIPLGTVQQFTATGTFSDSTTQDITGTVVWSASPTSVASITVSGLATGKDLGTVTVTATSGAINNSVMATVNAADLSSIAILPAASTIAQNTTQQFSAIGTFDDGSTHNLTAQVAWSSSNPAAASIGSSTGLATGLSQGTTTIKATLGSIIGSTSLDVSSATIVSISVTPTGRTIAPGTELSFTATGTFSDSSTQVITTDATWTSSDTAVATVGPEGEVTAVAAGTTNITAAFGGKSGSSLLTVSSVTLKSIAVAPATAVLAPASLLSYTATGTFSDGSTANVTDVVTWSSSATNVASISSFGQVTGQSAGTATITAQQGSVSGNAALVVESSTLSTVTVTPATATVAEQTATQFNAIGTFADHSTQNLTSSVSWTSSPASVATVSNASPTKGLATGVAPGTATITALFAGQSGGATLTVTNATLNSITVTPDPATISLGGTQQFTATGNFSDGSTENLTAQVTWSSSEVSVATISAGGLASTAGTGSTTITAKMNGASGTATLTVN